MARRRQRALGRPPKRARSGRDPGRRVVRPVRFATVPGGHKSNFQRHPSLASCSKLRSPKPSAGAGGWAVMPEPGRSARTRKGEVDRIVFDWACPRPWPDVQCLMRPSSMRIEPWGRESHVKTCPKMAFNDFFFATRSNELLVVRPVPVRVEDQTREVRPSHRVQIQAAWEGCRSWRRWDPRSSRGGPHQP